ncbi:MAG: septum formation initiator family protein [Clostridia bacterium]|nr:septum formation initiator family protein [Clostridia bacterium]
MKKRLFIYILTGLLLVYFVGMLISQQIKINEREKEIGILQSEIDEIKEESEKLKKEIENAESRETIESIAREELGLVYPDERKFVDSNG